MIVVLVSMGRAKGDTIAGTSESIRFNARRTGISDLTSANSNLRQHRAPRHHTPPEFDLDLDNLPTARGIALPGGEDWPLGNKGHSLDVAFGEERHESNRSGVAVETAKEGLSEDQRGREYQPQRAEGSSSALAV